MIIAILQVTGALAGLALMFVVWALNTPSPRGTGEKPDSPAPDRIRTGR